MNIATAWPQQHGQRSDLGRANLSWELTARVLRVSLWWWQWCQRQNTGNGKHNGNQGGQGVNVKVGIHWFWPLPEHDCAPSPLPLLVCAYIAVDVPDLSVLISSHPSLHPSDPEPAVLAAPRHILRWLFGLRSWRQTSVLCVSFSWSCFPLSAQISSRRRISVDQSLPCV